MQAYIWGPHIAVRLIWRCGYGTRCEWINDTNIWKNINNLGHPKWWTPCSVITYDTWQHDASWGRKRAGKYKLLLKRKQVTLTAGLESVNTLPDGWGGGAQILSKEGVFNHCSKHTDHYRQQILSHTHKTQLHFIPIYFKMEYIG